MIGSLIDKYEVLQKLGEGATATVYRGRHIGIGRDVAIKVLHPHLSASSRYRERFNREARAFGRLAHDNIVSILDYSGQQADDCYIVTELIEGSTLLAVLEEHGPLPSEIVAMIGMELCAALNFAHVSGVIHRDLKPENVMLRRDGRVKLMDFGVARMIDEGQITLDGSLLGSPAYMSPQQALDEKLDGRSDLFALGTVLFHTATGQVPFAGSNASVILRNIIDGARLEVLEANAAVAPALAAVIDRLLQPRPDDRYATAHEAGEALAAVLADSGIPGDHPAINLRSWLVQPQETNEALTAHLSTYLLRKGKERLATGDTVGALQLFNRLLAIDEENSEVLALITALHAPVRRVSRTSVWVTAAAGLLLLFAAVTWAIYPRDSAPRSSPVVAATPAPLAPEPPIEPTVKPLPPESPPPGEKIAAIPADRKEVRRTGVLSVVAPAVGPAAPLLEAIEAPVQPPATKPGKLTLELVRPAEVWLDGVHLGGFRTGPRETWVGTAENPIAVQPGTHRLELRNGGAIPFVEEFTLGTGEARHIRAELQEKPTVFVINSLVPRDCDLTVGTTHYGPITGFGGRISPPSTERETPVVFECPGRGRFEMKLPITRTGTETMLPVEPPAGML